MTPRSIVFGGLVVAGLCWAPSVRAGEPWYEELHHDLHEPWSFSPMFGAAVGGGDGAAMTTLELALRWRYGEPPDDRDGAPSPRLVAFGAALASTNTATLEPTLFIGYHVLPSRSSAWSQRVYRNLRADVGAGYRFARSEAPSGAVGYGKLAIGLVLARPATHEAYGGGHGYTYTKDRFRTELDLVVKAQVGQGGHWYVVAGVELDPLRIVPDAWRLLRCR
jgi:hypothetical protein